MDRLTPGGPSKWTLTKAPEISWCYHKCPQYFFIQGVQQQLSTSLQGVLTWHGRVAGEEERSALLDDACEPVADGVDPQVGPVVTHPHHDRGLPTLGCNKQE